MIQDKSNPIHWYASDGHTIIRKADGFDMGSEIWLGVKDSIENYEQQKKEEYEEY